jgi:hypothetical protein
MRFLARNEQQRSRRDRLNVIERVEVHEFDVARKCRMRGELGRSAFRSEFTAWRAVEVVKLTLNRVSILVQLLLDQ